MEIIYQTKYGTSFHIWHRSRLPKTRKHLHKSAEIIYLEEGTAECSVDFTPYTMQAGDILVVFPEQLHEYTNPTADYKNYAILFPAESPAFGKLFENYVPACAKISGAVTPEIKRLFAAAYATACNKDNPYAKIAVQGYVSVLLAALLQELTLVPVVPDRARLEVRLLRYVANHFTEPLSLSKVAADFGYSKSYLSHLFSKKFRVCFSEFVNTLRIEAAKEKLQTAAPITEIAYACGFSGIRNFNRVFLEQVGKSPCEYRAAARLS